MLNEYLIISIVDRAYLISRYNREVETEGKMHFNLESIFLLKSLYDFRSAIDLEQSSDWTKAALQRS